MALGLIEVGSEDDFIDELNDDGEDQNPLIDFGVIDIDSDKKDEDVTDPVDEPDDVNDD